MTDCLFCRIASGEIPAQIVYKDEELVAFHDISPQAPMHFLIVPVAHIGDANSLGEQDDAMIGRVHRLAADLARERGYADSGYRVVVNCGPDAGQSVHHLHFHVLGGRALQWPPG